MRTNYRLRQFVRFARIIVGSGVLFTVAAAPALHAQRDDEFDSYRVRLEGFWVYSTPSGTLQGSADSGTIDLTKDFELQHILNLLREAGLEVHA